MRLTKTLSFEHKSRLKQLGEKDIKEKFVLIKLLRKQFDLLGLTGETIQIPNTIYHRMPDVTIPQKNIVIELDGEIHENDDELTKLERDKDRDLDYKEAGYKLIIINKESTNGYKTENVIQVLEKNGLVKQ